MRKRRHNDSDRGGSKKKKKKKRNASYISNKQIRKIGWSGNSTTTTSGRFNDTIRGGFRDDAQILKRHSRKKKGTNGKSKTAKFRNDYKGFRIDDKSVIPILKEPIDPKRFFEQFVAKRRPCVFRSSSSSSSRSNVVFKSEVKKKWSDLKYLSDKAGDVNVRVERRSSNHESFGRGQYENMRFAKFLKLLEEGRGSEAYYMNTQRFEGSEDELLTGPLKKLCDDFPLIPDLCQNLIPADYNVWMGRTGESSSGLHHDYHDNLYVLLKGRKRFRLFSPRDAQEMKTHGNIKRVWQNGCICYSKDILADGVHRDDRKRFEVETRQKEIENEMEIIQKKLKYGSSNLLEETYARLETELEDILESSLSLMMENETSTHRSTKIEIKNKMPPHFSQIDINNVNTHTPSFREAYTNRMATVEIEEGDMLYLPAGWFHEVQSKPSAESPWHFAFNYWFHPPTTSSFEEPYDSKYHSNVWDSIIKDLK